MRLIPLLVLLAACPTRNAPSNGSPEPAAAAEPAPAPIVAEPTTLPQTRPTSGEVIETVAPAGVEGVLGLLRARDGDGVPDRDTLASHDDAMTSLVWIAANGEPMAVRVRALRALGYYPDAAAVDAQLEVLRSDDAHASLKAGAIRGLAERGLTAGTDAYVLVEGMVEDADPRIATAADTAIKGAE